MTGDQQAVFAAVVAVRLVVPLFIPRFPLPAILLALVVDGIDQTIFQAFHMTAVLANYQGYDKALDVYYLVIAYTATLRNWSDPSAFRVGQFLWYWRLIGVVIFEFAQWRPVLLIFPNTFEYFFIAYEAVRTLWRPERLSKRVVIGLAAAIWIFVKLPQEWWIHVAELDATDEIAAHPVVATVVFSALAALVVAAFLVVRRTAPPPDWRFSVDVDQHQPERRPDLRPADRRTWLVMTGEKAALTAMVIAIFAHILPTSASPGAIAVVAAAVTVLNAGISEVFEWRRMMPSNVVARLLLMVVLNGAIFEVLDMLRGRVSVNRASASFLLLLLSLIITLYDQFRGIRHGVTMRWPGRASTTSVAGTS